MVVKNLFDPAVKQEIIDRINKLTPQTQRQWGKMDVAQMLAHSQMPMGVALGQHQLKRGWISKLIGPLIKKKFYEDKPVKKGLPTLKTFVRRDAKEFEKEKQKLIEMIRNWNENNLIDTPHTFFGNLTREQWSKGTWKHLDHHLQQFGV